MFLDPAYNDKNPVALSGVAILWAKFKEVQHSERYWSIILVEGQELLMDERQNLRKTGGIGERVLGFCDLKLPTDKFPEDFNVDKENFLMAGLRFVRSMSTIDPPHAAVPHVVSKCRN